MVFHVARCVKVGLRKLKGEIFKNGIRRSRQDLAIRSLGSRAHPAFTQQNTVVDESDCCAKVWHLFGRDRRVGGCQNTAVDNFEVWFCKISARSKYIYGQRWGLLEQIFTSVVSRARARGREETQKWSPPEYVVLFSCFSLGNV